MEEKNILDKTELSNVNGAGGPSEYLYKGRIIYNDTVCNEEPLASSRIVCLVDANTTVYVLNNTCGNGYVECIFKGDKHRETGYILSSSIEIIPE